MPGQASEQTGSASRDPTTTPSQHHSRRQQHTQRSLAGKAPKTLRVQICSHNGSPRLQQQHAASPSAAASPHPPQLFINQSPSQAGFSNSSPGTCHTTRGFFLSSCSGQHQQQQQPEPQQLHQQQQPPESHQDQLQPPTYAPVTFKLQHLRLEVLSPEGSPRSRCSKMGPKTARTPATGQQNRSAAPPCSLAGEFKQGNRQGF